MQGNLYRRNNRHSRLFKMEEEACQFNIIKRFRGKRLAKIVSNFTAYFRINVCVVVV